jgi:hypothetical protein
LTLIKVKRSEYKNPETELVARLVDRAENEGSVSTEETDIKYLMGLQEGFIVSFHEDDKGWTGLGYKKHQGKEVELKTPICKTRHEAGHRLMKYIRAFNR